MGTNEVERIKEISFRVCQRHYDDRRTRGIISMDEIVPDKKCALCNNKLENKLMKKYKIYATVNIEYTAEAMSKEDAESDILIKLDNVKLNNIGFLEECSLETTPKVFEIKK